MMMPTASEPAPHWNGPADEWASAMCQRDRRIAELEDENRHLLSVLMEYRSRAEPPLRVCVGAVGMTDNRAGSVL